MKLSTEAKAGVMVAVSFLGLGGVLVGKKYLDPDNPITALASENTDPSAKEPGKENEGDSKKGEKPDPQKEQANPAKKENGNIILAKNEGQVPAFSPTADTTGKTGASDLSGKTNTPDAPFNPFPTALEQNNGLPGGAGAAKDKDKGNVNTGSSAAALPMGAGSGPKKDELAPFPFPVGANSNTEKKSTAGALPSAGTAGSGSGNNPFPANSSLAQGGGGALGSPPAPAPLPSNSVLPTLGNEGSAKGNDLNKNGLKTSSNAANENKLEGGLPNKKPDFPFSPSPALATGVGAGVGAGLGAAASGAGLSGGSGGSGMGGGFAGGGRNGSPDPLPAPNFSGGSPSAAIPALEKSGLGGNGATGRNPGELLPGGNSPPLSGNDTNAAFRNLGNPRNEMPSGFRPSAGSTAGGSALGGSPADNSLSGRSGSGNLGASPQGGNGYPNRELGSAGNEPGLGSFSGGGATGSSRGAGNFGGMNDSNLGRPVQPSTKPTVTTFSALTGPAKRTEFVPLEENPEPPLGRPAAMTKETTSPFPAGSGQNFPGGPETKSPAPAAFPLGQGPGREPLPANSGSPTSSPGSGPALPPLGRSDPFPPNSSFTAGSNSGVSPMSAGARPESFPLGMPPANPNGPVLKMPVDDKDKLGSGVQPAGFQYSAGGAQPGGMPNNPAMPGGANLGGGSPSTPFNIPGGNPANSNQPSPGAFAAPGGRPTAPGAFPGSGASPAPSAFPGSVPPPAPAAFSGGGSALPGAGIGAGLGATPASGLNPQNAPKVSAWSERVYSSAAGDTWDSIAQKEYQRKEMGRLLQAYNDIHPRAEALPKSGALPPRTEVFLPPAEELIKRGTGEVPMNVFPPNRP